MQTSVNIRPQLSSVVRYNKTRLVVLRGPDAGLSLEMAGSTVRIGTSTDNDLILTDATVSRRHCELSPVPRGIRLRDEGSKNGVTVDSVRVVDAVFTTAVKLELGDTVIGITPLDEVVDREQLLRDHFGDLLGSSPCMRELYADLDRIARLDISLLIHGETGTGKELVAESVHQHSERADKPFVVFDCSAVARSLVESELFGHERGAFTGALTNRVGVFEQADGGTIFLDELGELPEDLQPKLLRVLEKREVRRIGGTRTIPLNVRLISATHRNLHAQVRAGKFREDLYFRVAGAIVNIPPLRERISDIPILVEAFLAASSPPRSPSEIPQRIWDMLSSHSWPGNVRELRNAVQRLLINPERALDLEASSKRSKVPDEEAQFASPIKPLRLARRDASEEFERAYLRALLKQTNGSVARAADVADVSRQVLYRMLGRHEL